MTDLHNKNQRLVLEKKEIYIQIFEPIRESRD